MKIAAENLHIISGEIREALQNRDEKFLTDILTREAGSGPDWIDLNIGPAKKSLAGIMKYLTEMTMNITEIPISFDSSNAEEIKSGLEIVNNPEKCIINSTSADEDRLETLTSMSAEYGNYLVALTLSRDTGIPKTAEGRSELAFKIIEKTEEKGIPNGKIMFDPLILPIGVDQTQATAALESIRMFKESFDPEVLTVVGLSNISNGSPKEIRPLINRTFAVLAHGAGLDCIIADVFDEELLRLNKVLETGIIQKPSDRLNLELSEMIKNFGDIRDVNYDKNSPEEVKIYKTAGILLNREIYSHSYTEI